jgi:hypothetical protein
MKKIEYNPIVVCNNCSKKYKLHKDDRIFSIKFKENLCKTCRSTETIFHERNYLDDET